MKKRALKKDFYMENLDAASGSFLSIFLHRLRFGCASFREYVPSERDRYSG